MVIENVFPDPLLIEYHKWVGPDKYKAVGLCTLNLVISESLYFALSMFEVTLRDSINQSLVEHYGIDWTFQGKVKYHSESIRMNVDPQRSTYKKYNLSENALNNKVVSDMNLHYWTNIIDPINSELWKEIGNKSVFNKREIYRKADRLRKLRNRIAHLQSIVQSNLRRRYDDCREIIGLLSQDRLAWCDSNCRFLKVHPGGTIIENNLLSPNLDLTPWMQFKERIKE